MSDLDERPQESGVEHRSPAVDPPAVDACGTGADVGAAERRMIWQRVMGGMILVIMIDLWAVPSVHWIGRSSNGWSFPFTWFAVVPLFVLGGWFAAQIGSAAAYTALGTSSPLRRILVGSLATMLVGCGTLVAVQVLSRRAIGLGDQGILLVFVALLFYFLIQIPFWILRFYRGWAICGPWEPRDSAVFRRRFSLWHMFGWSTFVAVPLVLLRVLVEPSSLLVATLFGGIAWLFCSAHAVGYLFLTMAGRAGGGILLLTRQLTVVLLFSSALLVVEVLAARWVVPDTPAREMWIVLSAVHLAAAIASFGWWRWLQRWGFWLRRPLQSGSPLPSES